MNEPVFKEGDKVRYTQSYELDMYDDYIYIAIGTEGEVEEVYIWPDGQVSYEVSTARTSVFVGAEYLEKAE